MKKILIIMLTLILAISLFAACGEDTKEKNTYDDPANSQIANETPVTSNTLSYVRLRINPEIELLAEDGKVISVSPLNEDAEVLLSDINLEGKTLEEASEVFVEEATSLGYIDEENEENEVFVDIVTDDEEELDEINEKINKSLNEYFNNNGINGRVNKETIVEFSDDVEALNLPNGHSKMLMRALDTNPESDLSEIKDLPVKDLIRMINSNLKDENLNYSLNKEYKEEKNSIEAKNILKEKTSEIDVLQKQLEDENLSNEEKIRLENKVKELIQERTQEKENIKNRLNELKNKYEAKKAAEKAEKKSDNNAKDVPKKDESSSNNEENVHGNENKPNK